MTSLACGVKLCKHHRETGCDGLCAWCTDSQCDCPYGAELKKARASRTARRGK